MRQAVDPGMRLAALALAWIAGVGLHLQQRTLWPDAACAAAVALGLLGLAAAWRWRRAFVVALLGAALLAFGAAGLRASVRLADALPDALEGQDVSVTGVITTLPQRSASGLRFRFEVEAAASQGQPVRVPELLAIGWYKGMHEDAALSEPQAELRAGQRWRFTLRLRQPHGNLNPHGFDYELNLFEQGVRATGYVRDAPAPELLHRAAGYPIERLRQRVRDAIDASVLDHRAAGVLAALAVGDQGAIVVRDKLSLGRAFKCLPMGVVRECLVCDKQKAWLLPFHAFASRQRSIGSSNLVRAAPVLPFDAGVRQFAIHHSTSTPRANALAEMDAP